MSLQSAVLRGVAEPQIVHRPTGVVSLGAALEAIELAESVGLVLDEFQRGDLEIAMGERADGTWAADEVCHIVARQNGKGDVMIARQLFGLFLAGEELQIVTAHEFPTANESFLRLVGWIEGSDDLRPLVARIRYANGEQGVELKSGARLKYRARTGGSGRGFAGVSTLYYDEAMYLTDAHMAASKPALSTHPNPQTWYASSAGLSSSAPLWRLRKRALKGDAGRLGYIEHTAERVEIDEFGRVFSQAPDPDDREAWALANPTLGDRISVEWVVSERGSMSPEVFLRERLSVWDPELGEDGGPWPPDVWHGVLGDVAPSGALVFGVDANPPDSPSRWASVGVGDGSALELVDRRPGLGWLVPRLVDLVGVHGGVVAVDPNGPAGHVCAELEAAGVTVLKVAAGEMGRACGSLHSRVSEGRVGVYRGPLVADLNAAVSGARTVAKGDVWVWARRDLSVDVSPLVAVTLADWAAVQRQAPTSGGFWSGWDDLD